MALYTKIQPVVFPVKKIKIFMQKNQKIGKLAPIAPIIISKLLELVTIDILNETMCIMERKKSSKLKKKYIKQITKKRIFNRF